METRAHRESELLDLLYSAAADPAYWNEFLAHLAGRLDASAAGFISHDPFSQKNCLNVHYGMPSDAPLLCAECYGTIDPWFSAYKRKNLRRWIGLGSDLCPPSEFENTEYHTDFFRARDIFYQCGAIIEQKDGGLAVLTALRSKSHADFDTTHVHFLNKIHPHVERALRLHARMLHLKSTASAATRAVDSLDVALVGLETDGTVCFANGLAESLFRSGEVLRLRNRKIVAQDPRAAAAFEYALKQASRLDVNADAAGALTVHSGGRTLHLAFFPFRANDPLFSGRLRVFLTITDPETPPKSREQLLMKLFRLTPAEARVAMLVTAGLEASEIAARTRTTNHTVRSHLKSIFQKTQVARQSQLTRLVSRLPGEF